MVLSVMEIISVILGIVGSTYIFPISVALFCREFAVIPSFAIPMVASWIFAAIMVLICRKRKIALGTRSAFVVVALAWVFVSLFGSLPLFFSGSIPDFTDAFFESCSGFSTTGATILSDVECLPRSINLWRCQTHWLGGMGIVALTVALLPILGVGGFQLIKAETTGPEKGKLTPKIATTAKVLWFMYLSMTIIETGLLMLAGMDFVDALSHSFSTVGTGGFSSRNDSVGAYNSLAVDIIISLFMFLSGVNFSIYYYAITRRIAEIRDNSELKVYCAIVIVASLLITIIGIGTYNGFFTSARYSVFQVLSVLTTTGFATADYTTWHNGSQAVILLLFFIGGCSGSTSGGVKVIRWVIFSKQLHNEFSKMLHPHGVFTIRLNKRAGRKDVVFNVAAFFFVYVFILFLTTFFGALSGMDVMSAFSGAFSMAGNVGPGFNLLGPSCNYGFLAPALKWWYCFVMIAGRLEFFTMVIFFSPLFWHK